MSCRLTSGAGTWFVRVASTRYGHALLAEEGRAEHYVRGQAGQIGVVKLCGDDAGAE